MRAHLVLRVSTDRQAKAGTIGAQRGPVRELAQRLGATELVEWIEEATSGNAPLDERDVMRRLLAEAKPGDLVVAFDLSRLTRAESMTLRYAVLGFLADARVQIATCDDGVIDLTSLGGRIQLHVKGEVAADERKRIKARMTAGKRAAAAQGRKPAGSTPFGWRFDRETRHWSLREPEASVRREILTRIADQGHSTIAIAADLERRGVPYPARQGAQAGWTPRRVWHFAVQRINIGEWTFDGHVITVPALVDAETFARVQTQLSANQERGRRRTQHVYLLDENHGRCGLCGAPLRIQWGGSGSDIAYYVCERRLDEKSCELPWWRVDEADGDVWGEVEKILQRPDLVEEALRDRATETSTGSALAAKEIADCEKQLQNIARAREVVTRQMEKGNYPEAEAERQLERMARMTKLLEGTLSTARQEAEQARAAVAEIEDVKAYLQLIREETERANPAERRRICRALAPRVRLGVSKVEIGVRLRQSATTALVGTSAFLTTNHCETDAVDLTVTVERARRASR